MTRSTVALGTSIREPRIRVRIIVHWPPTIHPFDNAAARLGDIAPDRIPAGPQKEKKRKQKADDADD
jgi:hypothetical protein